MNASYSPSVRPQDSSLTPRQRRMVVLVSAGFTNRELGQKLGISEKAAQQHLITILDKLGIVNRLELVLFAVHHGLLDPA